MRSHAPRSWLLLLMVLLALALLPAPAAQAQERERLVEKQEFIRKLGGDEPMQSPVRGLKLRGPAGVKAAGQAAPTPKEVATSIHFKHDSTELADDFSRSQLREAGEALASGELRGLAFEIGGHTDGTGTEAYNQALSLRRAQAVKDALCRGFAVDCATLSVKGYGKSAPVAPNDDEAGRAQNRRVVFRRLP